MNRSRIIFASTFALSALLAVGTAHAAESQMLTDPLGFKSISEFVAKVLDALVRIALPIISLFVVYSGFLFVWARGNKDQLEKAKLNFLWVIIGTLLILGASTLSKILEGTLGQIK
jgi:hypothetical protein